MTLNPKFFTYEKLSSLKFKELQKLSIQLCVNRRWAKKQDLINSLLALKDNEASNNDKALNINQDEEKEWKDGYLVFNNLEKSTFNENKINKRLTFNITHKSEIDPRLTFEVPKDGKNFLDIRNRNTDSRQTYHIASKSNFDVQPSIEPGDVFDSASREQLSTIEHDPRATFNISKNENKSLEINEINFWKNTNTGNMGNINNEKKLAEVKDSAENPIIKKGLKKITFDSFEKEKPKKDGFHVEMPTPTSGITKRTKKNGEIVKTHSSPIKMSKKSINIKKPSKKMANTLDLIKSSALSPLNKCAVKETTLQPLTKCTAGKMMQSKIPMKLQLSKQKSMQKEKTSGTSKNNRENVKADSSKNSKTADEILMKKPSSVNESYMCTPVFLTENPKVGEPVKKTPHKENIEVKYGLGTFRSQTQSTSVITKPITATKMPDFSKIHKKQFEQMDSIHEYLRKKEERTKRLFGTPRPAPQLKGADKSMPLFQFQSIDCENSEVKLDGAKLRIPQNGTTFLNKKNNEKYARKEIFKKQLPPRKCQSEIKEKNRSQILGVRTNKRFELQMKFRKM